MPDPLTAEVTALVAAELGLPTDKITPTGRLLQDFGMDGDDAVEFFEVFGTRYGVDLTALYHHWGRHFGGEGFGTPFELFIVLVLAVLPPLILMPLGISPLWGWTAELLAVLVWNWPMRRWPLKDHTIPVTVEDLVIAAESKTWLITYPVGQD